jgi:hypothetical protein
MAIPSFFNPQSPTLKTHEQIFFWLDFATYPLDPQEVVSGVTAQVFAHPVGQTNPAQTDVTLSIVPGSTTSPTPAALSGTQAYLFVGPGTLNQVYTIKFYAQTQMGGINYRKLQDSIPGIQCDD